MFICLSVKVAASQHNKDGASIGKTSLFTFFIFLVTFWESLLFYGFVQRSLSEYFLDAKSLQALSL